MILLIVLSCFLISALGTRALVVWLTQAGRMDQPNQRSSHVVPTPRGGGLAMIAAILPAWAMSVMLTGWGNTPLYFAVVFGSLLLAYVSWRDDRRAVPWPVRLAAQLVAVAPVLACAAVSLFPVIPPLLITLAAPIALLAWLWKINLVNFMDGIDGLVASELIAIGLGAALCFYLNGSSPALILCSLTLSAASAGFLLSNWPPAKIFMGDVGSIPAGFFIGFLMLTLSAEGLWGVALALPSLFIADATLTLLLRWWRGEKITEAHRQHFYQQAAGHDRHRHRAVVLRFFLANLLIIVVCALGTLMRDQSSQILICLAALIIAVGLLVGLNAMAKDTLTPPAS